MDGNGRWAAKKGLPRFMGHRAGMTAVREVIEAAADAGVRYLSLFAFSTENWKRPSDEISALMALLVEYLDREIVELVNRGVRMTIIGDRSRLPPEVAQAVQDAEERTRSNDRLQVNIALSYGGRWDILQAARSIALEVKEGLLDPEDMTEDMVSRYLATGGVPDPDMIIRASGELRLSNFYLWQAAYSEIWSTPVLWPDFRRHHFEEALQAFSVRQRRYGEVFGEEPDPC
jgi:undecaprenyl diphosphate synthase